MWDRLEQEPLQQLYQETLEEGIHKKNRTHVDTISHFGPQIRIDLQEGFPLPTVKDTWFHAIKHELIWFIRGDTNIRYLATRDPPVPIWYDNYAQHYRRRHGLEELDPQSKEFKEFRDGLIQRVIDNPKFAEEEGDMGPIYAEQWTNFGAEGINQLEKIKQQLQEKPDSRRHIVTAWNPADVPYMALPPCHTLWQLYVNNEGELSCKLHQRSADLGLGVPFNIPSYAALTHIMGDQTGYEPNEFIHSFGDAHIYCGSGERAEWYEDNFPELQARVVDADTYEDFQQIRDWVVEKAPPEPDGAEDKDHIPAVLEMLSREPRERPTLELESKPSFEAYEGDDIQVTGYNPHEKINMEMAV